LAEAIATISPVTSSFELSDLDAVPPPGIPRDEAAARPLPLSIVLATLNEIEALPTLLEELNGLHLPSFEVIVVDDGSTDGTREFVNRAALANPRIRLLSHDGRRTLGPAQSEGIRDTSGEYVIIMDSDLQHPTELLPRLIEELDSGADLVIASRYCDGGSAGERPVIRSVISRGAELIAKALLPEARNVRDPLSGYFAFRRASLRPEELPGKGYKLLLQLLVMFQGARVVEVPYQFRHRMAGASKITSSMRFVPLFISESLVTRRYRSRVLRAYRYRADERESAASSVRS